MRRTEGSEVTHTEPLLGVSCQCLVLGLALAWVVCPGWQLPGASPALSPGTLVGAAASRGLAAFREGQARSHHCVP